MLVSEGRTEGRVGKTAPGVSQMYQPFSNCPNLKRKQCKPLYV